jgi:hypothetical protein
MHMLLNAAPPSASALVEISCNWYIEDMVPMEFLPHAPNSHGYIPPTSIETIRKDRFQIRYSERDEDDRKQNPGNNEKDFMILQVWHTS